MRDVEIPTRVVQRVLGCLGLFVEVTLNHRQRAAALADVVLLDRERPPRIAALVALLAAAIAQGAFVVQPPTRLGLVLVGPPIELGWADTPRLSGL